MRIYFTTIVWLLAVRGSLPSEVKNNGESLNTPCESATVDKTSYTGDSVSFTFKYPQADKNSIRHFCSLDGNNSCSNIISVQFSSFAELAKFSLSDDKQQGLYQVNISMVTQQDSGKYWCALKTDDFNTCLQEVVLHVLTTGSLPSEVENNGDLFNTPCESATVDQTSYTGDSVSFTCKCSQADKNSIRHFCRLDGNNSCSNVISVQFKSYTKLVNFSLSDDKQQGLYQVNISMVTQQDSGKYWCALKTENFITFLQDVVLHVLRTHTTTTTTTAHENGNQATTKGMIAGIVCGVVIVVVLAIVLILCRRKLCNRQGETSEQSTNTIQSPEGKDRDHQYEEIQIQKQQANTASTLYSTVNPPADQLHYASVNIQGGDPPTGTDQNPSADPPAVTTLYSTVKKPGE
ncbi:CMRF35-like molecule 8 [Gambusia affinis]|uniref:CMRF35-like molecule 8 n=1 Tax=Gambusia affinis TaxID=33528 RepID=UPI001CDB6125|nr:CMRF35-like molecule 8 [Gambusia affinis]